VPSHAEFVDPAALIVGNVYFRVGFHDEEILIPELVPLVFIGRDLIPGDMNRWYFQDYTSFRDGVRFDQTDTTEAVFDVFGGGESVVAVCEYERALDQLLRCSLRRRGKEVG